MIGTNWFQKKWGTIDEVPIDDVYKRLSDLEIKYQGALQDIKRLEEENIENTNLIYELMENIRALDARIDIVASEPYNLEKFGLEK